MTVEKDKDTRLDPARVCLVIARSCSLGESSPAFAKAIEDLLAQRQLPEFPGEELKNAVRAMLRAGGFKPAGRQKPASEYLAQAAREGRFPFINCAVDVNNYFSLKTGLPISLLDLDAFGGSARLRVCGPGESYVFNNAGHEMDLAGLLCVCGASGRPLGNPVKDSMIAKLKEDSRDLAGFIYAPAGLFDSGRLRQLGEEFAALLREQCGASAALVAGMV